MKISNCYKISLVISILIFFLFFISSIHPVQSVNFNNITRDLKIEDESKTLSDIKNLLKKINKRAVKTIQSPDGDLIDCVPFHLQLAFDHPLLKQHELTMDPPEMPKENTSKTETEISEENFQLWSMSGESCPENTVAIRRTTEQDILRAKSFQKSRIKKDASDSSHEHAIGFATGKFFGAKALLNVWSPHVANVDEFSLSQMWIMDGSIKEGTLNSIEVGWKVNHGENIPRLFTYWTRDAYYLTGCYNTECAGFIHKSPKIALGAGIRPVSSYNGKQFDITILVWRDPKNGNWWLSVNDIAVGFWPSSIFSLFRPHATVVEFGGEIVNTGSSGRHTSTQMGSGHSPAEGFGRAAYIRNIQVVDLANHLVTAPNLLGVYEDQKCYYAGTGAPSKTWGNYMFFGGPVGKYLSCPL